MISPISLSKVNFGQTHMRMTGTEITNQSIHILSYLVLLLLCALAGSQSPEEAVHRRFEYKYSFKGPHIVQKDNSIPFWEYSGSALASPDQVRITPSLRSKKGAVWAKTATNFEFWEVEVALRITGRGRIGADGVALWYTSERGQEGDVYGSSDEWKGVGVFFDSFDNDGLQNNPYIMVVLNDGTKKFHHQTDGRDQQIAGCLKDFRNKPFPVKAKLEYVKNVLTLSISNGLTKEDNYEICVRAENIFLPQNGFFGMSAATGGLADDHDVLSFITHSITDPTERDKLAAAEEQARYDREYNEYQEKLEKEKKKFQEEHPEEQGGYDDEDPSKWYESPQARELRQIFDGQTDIQHTVRLLHKKIDEITVRQDTAVNQMIALNNRPAGGGGGGSGLNPQQIQSLMEIGSSVEETKRILNDLKNVVSVQSGSAASQDLKEYIRNVIAQNKPEPCPTVKASDCVSTTSFMIMLLLQAILVIGYLIYKSNKEAQAKKFY